MNRIYCAIGKIMEVTQHIEVAVLNVCELSEIIKEFSRHKVMTQSNYLQVQEDAKYLKQKMTTMTFGGLVGIIYESKSLAYEEINELKALLEKRNYFTHEYFKYTNFNGSTVEEFILEEFNALKEYLSRLKKMENRLETIMQGQKNRLEYLVAKNKLN